MSLQNSQELEQEGAWSEARQRGSRNNRKQNNHNQNNSNGNNIKNNKTKAYNDGGNYSQSNGKPNKQRRTRNKGKPADYDTIKSIFVNKVHMKDLEQDPSIAPHLKQQRVKCLKDVLSHFGELEQFIDQTETQNSVFVSYKTRDNADKAIKALRNKEEAENLMALIRQRLDEQKMSKSICPNLSRYLYGFAVKEANKRTPKTAYANQKTTITQAKTVVAGSNSAPANTNTSPVITSNNNNNNATANSNNNNSKKQKKQKKETNKVTSTPSNSTLSPALPDESEEPARVEYLKRETEIARLKQEFAFITKQQSTVQSELKSERERVNDRNNRIKVLDEDFVRVTLERDRLERQLTTERQWKEKGEESINKLEEELAHLEKQLIFVETRLKDVQSPATPTGAPRANGSL